MLKLIFTVFHYTRKRDTQPFAAPSYIQHSRRTNIYQFNKIAPFYTKIPLPATHFFVIKEYICGYVKNNLLKLRNI